jgi:hypothetical protein
MPQPVHTSVLGLAAAVLSLLACVPEPTHKKADASPAAAPGTGGAGGLSEGPGSGGTGGGGSDAGGTGGTVSQPPPAPDARAAADSAPVAADASSPPAGAASFMALYSQILTPGCTGPNGACHSVLRHQYFLFAEGEQMKSYMLLVPTAAKAGTVPQRVMSLLSHVTPSKAGDPSSVEMPPQSGPRLGNPPLKKPPLTADQIARLKEWAMGGAKYE